jgi:hypothetical protein
MRKPLCLSLAFALGLQPGARAQQPIDPQVAKGIEQVERADMAGAILTLDAAARRLAAVSRPYDLARAYLYLGVAYAAEGHETLAKARFRDALRQEPGLSLDANRFAARAVQLLEEAKREAAAGNKPQHSSRLPKLLLAGAAAAGAAVLLGRGANDVLEDFTGFYGTYPNLTFTPQTPGCLQITTTLELTGNPNGTNFRISQTSQGGGAAIVFTSEINNTGRFRGSGGGFSILGQTNGTRIAGSETRESGGPACTWTFDGTR